MHREIYARKTHKRHLKKKKKEHYLWIAKVLFIMIMILWKYTSTNGIELWKSLIELKNHNRILYIFYFYAIFRTI